MGKKKSSFYNPIKQNYGHIKALSALLNIEDKKVIIPIACFTGSAKLKLDNYDGVVLVTKLKDKVLSYKETVFSKEDIKKYSEILTKSDINTSENMAKHIDTIKKQGEEYKQSISEGICPRCGGKLVERKGKYGTFTGCSNYPKCRFTKKD